MAAPLKINKIDSPLARRHEAPEAEPPRPGAMESGEREAHGDDAPTRAPAALRSVHGARRGRRPAAAPPDASPAADATAEGQPARELGGLPQNLWEPPALDEPGEMLAARVPASLVRAMERHTRALRDAHGGASQKRLPAHEVIAAVLWAVGDPDDPDTAERVARMHRQYRGRRMAAAARKALEADGGGR